MSKNLTFLSLTDNSLLIQDKSFTGAEIDSLVSTGISFFDAKITHNQLYRYFFHETTKADEVFDRIATYHRKFFETIKAEEVLFKNITTGLDTEEVKLDSNNFAYEWLRIRKFNDNVKIRDLLDPVKVQNYKDAFKIGEERVEKVLPPITTTDEAVWFDPRIVIELTKGSLPLQLAGGKDDLIFVGNAVLSRDAAKTFEKVRLQLNRVASLDEAKFDDTTINFEQTKSITQDAAKFFDTPLVAGKSSLIKDSAKVLDNDILLIGKNVIRSDATKFGASFIDSSSNEQLLKRKVGKTAPTEVAKATENVLTLGQFELARDEFKTFSDETLLVGKNVFEVTKLQILASKKISTNKHTDATKFIEKLIAGGQAVISQETVKILSPVAKSASIIAHINPVTKDIDKIKFAANRDTSPTSDNFVNLGPGLHKEEVAQFLDKFLNSGKTSVDVLARDRLGTSEDKINRVYHVNKSIPRTFSQEEHRQTSPVDFNEPAIKNPAAVNTRPASHDPYFTYLWQNFYKDTVNPITGQLEYPSIYHPRFRPVDIDDRRREDYAFASAGNDSLRGDTDPRYASANGVAYYRLIPVWDGQQWRSPAGNPSIYNTFPTHNAVGRRINLGLRAFTPLDFEKARKAIYNSEGQLIGYQQLPLGAPTGETVWDSLRRAGITLGRFQLHLKPGSIEDAPTGFTENIVAKAESLVPYDRVLFGFYNPGQNPLGQPEDVKLKKSLGRRRDIAELIGRRFKRVEMRFSEANSRPGEVFKGKDLIAALADKAQIEHDRFHAFFNPRGHVTPDVNFAQGKGVPTEIIKLEGTPAKRLETEKGPELNAQTKTTLNAIAYAQAQVLNSEKIITSSFSRNLLARSIDEGVRILHLIPSGPYNPYVEPPPNNQGVITRVGEDLYASYSVLTGIQTTSVYTYTNLNEYTERVIPDYELGPLGWLGSSPPPTAYAGSYSYQQRSGGGYVYRYGTLNWVRGRHYFSTGSWGTTSAGFFWDDIRNHWVLLKNVDFQDNLGPFEDVIDLPSRTNSLDPGPGAITFSDPIHGGLINSYLFRGTVSRPTTIVPRLFWEKLGSIESLFEGDAPVYDSNGPSVQNLFKQSSVYRHTDGHLYLWLFSVKFDLGGGYGNSFFGTNYTGTSIGGAGWIKISNRTGASLTPPGEILSILTALDTEYSRKIKYDRPHTETIKVADPGSAYIPVYCASYFLEPYVSEAGKSANF